MLIEEIMTTDLITVDESETLHDAVGRMLTEGVPYGVITDGDVPSGLLTERTVVRACYETGNSMQDIPVRRLANGFGITLQPDTTVLFASAAMIKHDVDVMPVMDGISLEGVLTRDDVMANVQRFKREAIDLEGRQSAWESPGGDLW